MKNHPDKSKMVEYPDQNKPIPMDVKTAFNKMIRWCDPTQPRGQPLPLALPPPHERERKLLRAPVWNAAAFVLIVTGISFLVAQSGGGGRDDLGRTNVIESGSGSAIGRSCNFPLVQSGAILDPCNPVLGLSCASDSTCRCLTGIWDGRRCALSPSFSSGSTLVRVPRTFSCGPRCSAQYDFTGVTYESTTADCARPVMGSQEYFLDCTCMATEGKPYADFAEECQRREAEPSAIQPTPLLPDAAGSCPASFCVSLGICVCCNGSVAADCSLTCFPSSKEKVNDCAECGTRCTLAADNRSCACPSDAPSQPEATPPCPNGAKNPPECTRCDNGPIGSVCSSEANSCGKSNKGTVLATCACSAVAPDEASCSPLAGTLLYELEYAKTVRPSFDNGPNPDAAHPPTQRPSDKNETQQEESSIMPRGSALGFGVVRGDVFHDANADGKRGNDEGGLPGVAIVITDANGIQQTLSTDKRGQYETIVIVGKASIAISSDNPSLGREPRFTAAPPFAEILVGAENTVRMDPVGVVKGK